MTADQLWIASLALAALGLLVLAGRLLLRLHRAERTEQRVVQLLRQRETAAAVIQPFPMPGLQPLGTATPQTDQDAAQQVLERLKPPAWLETGLAKALFAQEDRKLMEQAGIEIGRGGLIFVASRTALCLLLPVLVLLVLQPQGMKAMFYAFAAFSLGLMLPKWILRSKATNRRKQVVEELPLFVDLLRLLQGVGLSIDQSLHILATEFGSVLRVLSAELGLANRLYSSGRTREQSLQRLAMLGADDDMSAVVNLLVQVDRHGGAVQEPLREFSLRLREKRQANFKEKIGTITVKMTGVMVLTLLPALIVITAGPGFTAVIRSLSSIGGR
ncbi:type II secretion system F family protein [Comamonas koreensis]|uniref:Type II secretion system F family protein n=1 Tax=Comamonas koreensis TaxID=160825 RepID=A0AAW4XXR9_9BURK|nr:type II secretion system F family protein [Comamonas koreensis]MCD2166389.1 type II secretion system F family protein [Comamonas koreensis]